MERLSITLAEVLEYQGLVEAFRSFVAKRYSVYLDAIERNFTGESSRNTASSSVQGYNRPYLYGGEVVDMAYTSGRVESGRLYIKGDWALVDSERRFNNAKTW